MDILGGNNSFSALCEVSWQRNSIGYTRKTAPSSLGQAFKQEEGALDSAIAQFPISHGHCQPYRLLSPLYFISSTTFTLERAATFKAHPPAEELRTRPGGIKSAIHNTT